MDEPHHAHGQRVEFPGSPVDPPDLRESLGVRRLHAHLLQIVERRIRLLDDVVQNFWQTRRNRLERAEKCDVQLPQGNAFDRIEARSDRLLERCLDPRQAIELDAELQIGSPQFDGSVVLEQSVAHLRFDFGHYGRMGDQRFHVRRVDVGRHRFVVHRPMDDLVEFGQRQLAGTMQPNHVLNVEAPHFGSVEVSDGFFVDLGESEVVEVVRREKRRFVPTSLTIYTRYYYNSKNRSIAFREEKKNIKKI